MLRPRLAISSLLMLLACGHGARQTEREPTPTGALAGANSAAGASSLGGSAPSAGGSAITDANGGAAKAGAGGDAGAAPASTAGGAAVAGSGSVASDPLPPASGKLRIYWVDTEGGASTIIAAPDGSIIVVDVGFSSRDAQRAFAILDAELHATKIDALIVTHYHIDHVGGVPTLASMVPVSHFYDHGDAIESGSHINAYMDLVGQNAAARSVVKPGDALKFGSLRLTFVTSAEQVIDPPLPSAVQNEGCGDPISKSQLAGAENPESVGFLAQFGSFDFLDLGDFTWNVEQKLACPVNRVGLVDLYQVSHHGMDLSSSPQLVYSIKPLVALMNNGAAKGGAAATFELLQASPGLQDLWSLHRVSANDDAHNAQEALTANLAGQDQAYGLSATVEADGTFTITNARTNMSRGYKAR